MNEHQHRTFFDVGVAALAVGCVAAMLAWDAAADGRFATPTHAAWQAECGSCHVAYPPALLPARSWEAMMASLDRHFGVDASLPPAQARDIGAFLVANAARTRSAADDPPPQRITTLPWFAREHRKVAGSSLADCTACHRDAATGDFRESGLRVSKHAGRPT